MKIWFINHYAVPPQYYPLSRPYLFAKHLIAMGHEVTIFAASTAHNSDINLIDGSETFREDNLDGIKYVYIRSPHYKGNGIKRVFNIIEFARKLPDVLDNFEKPDVIMATVFDPLSCYQGIKYAKKYGIKAIAEIADLWPETLVSYGIAGKNNPVVMFLRYIEKRIYTLSDAIIFTFAGGYDYIKEQGWDNEIPMSKIYYINNGIDLKDFDYNKNNYITHDEDLEDDESFKVIYAGSIRRANNLNKLVDIAKIVKNRKIKFLVWGDGDDLPYLKKRIISEGINNVTFKGRVQKKYIPFITSKANLNIVHGNDALVLRFGISANKIFDYFAAGRPILCDFYANHNPIKIYNAGFTVDKGKVEDIAAVIDEISCLDKNKLEEYGRNARIAAKEFDFVNLTKMLGEVINSTHK